MTEEVQNDQQVHSTSQEAEPTQQAAATPESAAGELGNEQGAESQPENEDGGKDPNGWALKRISQLTQQRHEAERKAQAKESEAERYRLLLEQTQRGDKQTDTVTVPGEQPNIDELVTKRATELEQQRAMADRGQSVSKTGTDAYPDFMSAVQTLDALGISVEQVQSLLGMDDAHNVIYSLGKNPDEAQRILSLPPLQQGRELERLASKPIPAPAARPVSKAPKPVTPVDSSAGAEADPSKMSAKDWMAWREKTRKTIS